MLTCTADLNLLGWSENAWNSDVMQWSVKAKLSKLSPEATRDAFGLIYQLYMHCESVPHTVYSRNNVKGSNFSPSKQNQFDCFDTNLKVSVFVSMNIFLDRKLHTWHSESKNVGSEESGLEDMTCSMQDGSGCKKCNREITRQTDWEATGRLAVFF